MTWYFNLGEDTRSRDGRVQKHEKLVQILLDFAYLGRSKKMSNMDLIEKPGCTQAPAKGNQCLPFIRHRPC
jgi:hypothetical protein